jgi:hypothetical protein
MDGSAASADRPCESPPLTAGANSHQTLATFGMVVEITAANTPRIYGRLSDGVNRLKLNDAGPCARVAYRINRLQDIGIGIARVVHVCGANLLHHDVSM